MQHRYIIKNRSVMMSGANAEICMLVSDMSIEDMFLEYTKARQDKYDPYAFVNYSVKYYGAKIVVLNSINYTKSFNSSTVVQFDEL